MQKFKIITSLAKTTKATKLTIVKQALAYSQIDLLDNLAQEVALIATIAEIIKAQKIDTIFILDQTAKDQPRSLKGNSLFLRFKFANNDEHMLAVFSKKFPNSHDYISFNHFLKWLKCSKKLILKFEQSNAPTIVLNTDYQEQRIFIRRALGEGDLNILDHPDLIREIFMQMQKLGKTSLFFEEIEEYKLANKKDALFIYPYITKDNPLFILSDRLLQDREINKILNGIYYLESDTFEDFKGFWLVNVVGGEKQDSIFYGSL